MPDDDNLELKKRARRRLVGAGALALLAAIILPMVMDQEPRPLNQDVQIQIPRQEGDNFAARPIAPPAVATRPDTPAEPESPASTPPRPAPAPEIAKPESVKPQPAKTEAPKPAPKPELAKPEPAKPVPPKLAPPKNEAAKPEAAKAETPKAETAKADASRAEALLSGGQAETYVVQLGAYKDEANVTSLREKLKAEGFSAYTEKVADKTRVRVGPYPSRDAADKAVDHLRKIGLNGVVTAR